MQEIRKKGDEQDKNDRMKESNEKEFEENKEKD